MHLQEGHLPQVPLLQGERGGVGRLSGAPEERLDRGAAEDAATDREDEEGGDEDERMPPGSVDDAHKLPEELEGLLSVIVPPGSRGWRGGFAPEICERKRWRSHAPSAA